MQGLFKSDTLPGKAQEQINAIKILASQGYTIIDLEGVSTVSGYNVTPISGFYYIPNT